jgi:hypothetical protein
VLTLSLPTVIFLNSPPVYLTISFLQTGQESLLNAQPQDLPGVVDGMRKICSLESALLGNVSNVDNETSTATNLSSVPTINSGLAAGRSASQTILLLIITTIIGGLSLAI